MSSTIVLASNNAGKIREIQQLLAGSDIEIQPQSNWQVSEAEEAGLTFIENALIKARHAAQLTGMPAIGDDSGLEVDALKGAPGIYSSRYAGEGASDTDNIAKLLYAMQEVPMPQRQARFRCVICYLRHTEDPAPIICEGMWEGVIAMQPAGEKGFGYDPVFYLPREDKTAAMLIPEEKNQLSHRGQALRCFASRLKASYAV